MQESLAEKFPMFRIPGVKNYMGSETKLQMEVFEYCQWQYKDMLFMHPPNEGKHHIAYRNKQLKMGMLEGASDCLIFDQHIDFKGLAIELKANYNKPKEHQYLFMDNVVKRGWWAGWTRDYESAIYLIDTYMRGQEMPILSGQHLSQCG